MLYSVLFAACTSLLAVLLSKPKTTNAQLAKDLSNYLGTASELLLANLHLFQQDSDGQPDAKTSPPAGDLIALGETLTRQAAQIRIAYDEAVLEVVLSHFPMDEMEGLVKCTLHMRTLLVNRTGLKGARGRSTKPDEHISVHLRQVVDRLGLLNLVVLNKIRASVADSSDSQSGGLQLNHSGHGWQALNTAELSTVLRECTAELEEALAVAMGEAVDRHGRITHSSLFEGSVNLGKLRMIGQSG